MKLSEFLLFRANAADGVPFAYELLVKKHTPIASTEAAVPEVDFPADKTIFLVHVDPSISVETLKKCFEEHGAIKNIIQRISEPTQHGKQNKTRRSTPVVLTYISFKSIKGAQKVLSNSIPLLDEKPETRKRLYTFPTVDPYTLHTPSMSIAEWVRAEQASIKSAELLQREVNEFMLNFDIKKNLEKQKKVQKKQIDDDGFTYMAGVMPPSSDNTSSNSWIQPSTKQGGKLHFTRVDDTSNNKNKRKHGGREDDFYRFQQREAKHNEIVEMREAMNEDVKKVERMKKSKKFKITE